MNTVTTIQIANFASIYEQGLSNEVLLVDVRTPAEYHEEHLKGAINIPLDELGDRMEHLHGFNLVYLYCGTGNRSYNAGQQLTSAGITGVINLDGGITAWKEQKHETNFNADVGISIDRQVKLIAGLGVVTSILLSLLIHPALIGVALFIGSGLTFAGSTGICTLAILLARMPWNRRRGQPANPQRQTSRQAL